MRRMIRHDERGSRPIREDGVTSTASTQAAWFPSLESSVVGRPPVWQRHLGDDPRRIPLPNMHPKISQVGGVCRLIEADTFSGNF